MAGWQSLVPRHDVATPTPGGEPLVVSVPCTTSPGAAVPGGAVPSGAVPSGAVPSGARRWHRHDVVVTADWAVRTPHDLAAERIAAAFGGHLSCLALESNVVPAVRAALGRHLRVRPPSIVRRGHGWSARSALSCCPRTPFASTALAVEHLGGTEHLAVEFDAEPRVVRAMVAACLHAHGAVEHPAALDTATMLVPPAGAEAAGLVTERWGVRDLWDAGVHPLWVIFLHAEIGVAHPLPSGFYLGAVLNRPDIEWIADTVTRAERRRLLLEIGGGSPFDDPPETPVALSRPTSHRPITASNGHEPHALEGTRFTPEGIVEEPLVTWLAWTASREDRRRPAERGGWLEVGVPRRIVVDLLRSGYIVDDVVALAAGTGLTEVLCAQTLATWSQRGWSPTVADLVRLVELGPHLAAVPPVAAVEVFLGLVVGQGPAGPTEAALLVAACGSAQQAAHVWAENDRDWRSQSWDPWPQGETDVRDPRPAAIPSGA